ncbi:putative soluble epoxide hydrolase [Tanacetum coccineum]
MDGFVEPSFSLMLLHKMSVWFALLSNQLLQLIKINGLKLHVAETRFKSSPAMIFLHGFSEIQYTWWQQMTIVAKVGYGAVVPDYRGFGLIDTPVERDQIFFIDLVKDTGSILDHLNISKVIVWTGHVDKMRLREVYAQIHLHMQSATKPTVFTGEYGVDRFKIRLRRVTLRWMTPDGKCDWREWRSKTTPALAMVTMLAIMISIISRNGDIFSEIAIFGSVESLYGFVVKMLKTKSDYVAWMMWISGKSRHLGVRHSMIRELITNMMVSIEFVRSQQNLADHLTKGLTRDLVLKSGEGMGLKSN